MDIIQDLDQLAATLKVISPKDAAFIDKVLTGAKAFSHSNMTASMAKPPDMHRWWDTLKMMINMKGTLRYYSGWYLQSLKEATKALHDPWLAHVFQHLFLPDVPVVFVMIILGALAGGNLAFRKDGSGGFARALEKRYLDLGGDVAYVSTVEKILVEKDHAVGVRLSNGEECRADHIVSAADGYATLIESEWQAWKDIREDKDAYNAEKEMTGKLVLEGLNAVWPGIRDQVEMTDVATPHTWWRYTRNRRGAFEGFAITDKIFTTSVKRTLPSLNNFYMAGQWVVPGGGVIPTLVSGKHAAMLLCRRDGKTFSTASQAS